MEEDHQTAIDIRTDSLQALRELGPPDLVHLAKHPVKSVNKQVGEHTIKNIKSSIVDEKADSKVFSV